MQSFEFNGVTFKKGNKVVSRSTTGHKMVRIETLIFFKNECVFCQSGCFKNWLRMFKKTNKNLFKMYFKEVEMILNEKGITL